MKAKSASCAIYLAAAATLASSSSSSSPLLPPPSTFLPIALRGGAQSSSTSPDYYAILGIEKGATASQVTQAYRSKSLIYHPDKQKQRSSSSTKTKAARKMFDQVSEAYDCLKDTEGDRRLYDYYGGEQWKGAKERGWDTNTANSSSSSSNPFNSMFGNSFFSSSSSSAFGGGGSPLPRFKHRDMVYTLLLPLPSLFSGLENHQIKVEKPTPSGGTEVVTLDLGDIAPGFPEGGKIRVKGVVNHLSGRGVEAGDCIFEVRWDGKGGETSIRTSSEIEEDGETVTVPTTTTKGIYKGENVITPTTMITAIKATNKKKKKPKNIPPQPTTFNFKRHLSSDSALFLVLPLPLGQAVTGFEWKIKTIDGRTLLLDHDGGSTIMDGDLRRVEGEGLPIYGAVEDDGDLQKKKKKKMKGDLFILFKVVRDKRFDSKRVRNKLKRNLERRDERREPVGNKKDDEEQMNRKVFDQITKMTTKDEEVDGKTNGPVRKKLEEVDGIETMEDIGRRKGERGGRRKDRRTDEDNDDDDGYHSFASTLFGDGGFGEEEDSKRQGSSKECNQM
jgi:DnaJ-class molecular chaperone